MSTVKMAQQAQTLFVRNLAWTIGSSQLKEYFSAFGHISSAGVVFDKNTGMSRGYGFVCFSSKEAYDVVSMQNIHSLEGRVMGIEQAGAQAQRSFVD